MNRSVSVVMAVRNGEAYVEEAIDSVLAQCRSDDEFVIVDDGSTDGTPQILEGFGDRIVHVRQPHAGQMAALNRGLGIATGDMLAFQDADDIWCDDKLARQLAALDADPGLDAVFGMVRQFVSPEVPPDRRAALAPKIEFWRGELKPCLLIHRPAFEKVGLFDPSLAATGFIEWLGRAKRIGTRFGMVDSVVLQRRLHLANHGRINAGLQGRETLLALRRLIEGRRTLG